MFDRPATERTMMSLEAIRSEEAGDPRRARPARASAPHQPRSP